MLCSTGIEESDWDPQLREQCEVRDISLSLDLCCPSLGPWAFPSLEDTCPVINTCPLGPAGLFVLVRPRPFHFPMNCCPMLKTK